MYIDIYDFDHTVYDGDSTIDFYFYCLRHYPRTLRALPRQVCGALSYGLKRIGKTAWKTAFFSFLAALPDTDAAVEAFWAANAGKIKGFYRGADHSHDVIISASPEFLLAPICRQLGVYRLIATRTDPRTGVITGENCRGAEKVVRLNQELSEYHVGKCYSDSLSDLPILQLAEQPFLVDGDRITPYQP